MQISSSRSRARSRGRHAASSTLSVRGAVIAALFGSAISLAHAETPSFSALLARAQGSAPQLLEQAANVRAAQADVRQAGAWRNPTLDATFENLHAPESGGVSQRQDTYALTQVFELGGKRAARIEAEQHKAVATGTRERQARLTFATELALAYATAEAMQDRQAVAKAALERAGDDLRAAQALVKAGREAELRLAQARASAAAARAAQQSAAADATEALARLAALVGSPEPFTRIDHPFMARVAAAGTASGTAAATAAAWTPEQSPTLAAAAAERDALAAQVRVEQKRAIPDIGVSLGVRRFAWSSERAATVGVTASIPLFDRNRSGVDAARERANGAALRVEAARLDAVASHRAALAQATASEQRLQAAEEGETAALEAYRLGRIGYEAGKTPLLELLSIRRALADAQALTIDTRLARVRALAALSLAEGRLVFGEAP
ncbi:TolC family protein [Massilia sp. CFBP 13647]|uniref:TolC family protein n=3 Tax=unclassified Massilia TaxID=2609279 RepID=UPI00177C4FE7|nr:TolC family protein [Massilia sp. CFBP 13647]MBD8531669.1 TolC family protein [Massilia sp. CFBP 13647]